MELMKIETNESGEQLISGRELYEFLEVGTSYKDWFPRMCDYGFIEGIDFNSLNFEQVQIEGTRQVKRNIQNHLLKLDMAKEISMLQRSDKGKQARQYFIEIEKAWNSPEKIMARALQIAEQHIISYKQQILEYKPKVDYCEKVLESISTYTTTQIAKELSLTAKMLNSMLHQSGIQYKVSGEWVLYAKYQNNDYTDTETITYENSKGETCTRKFQKWTEKGRLFIHEWFEGQ